MSTSITASTNCPYNGLLLQDALYTVTASYAATATTASTGVVDFKVATPWPTTSELIVWVGVADTTASTGSTTIVLQDSANNSVWTPVANLANPILTSTGSIASQGVYVGLQPGGQRYLRASAITSVGTVSTGSVTLAVLF